MANMEQAGKIGDLLNSWTKIIFIFGSAVVSCALAYYRIYENEGKIKLLKKEFIKVQEISEQRSDKRYNRAMKLADKFEKEARNLEVRIRKLEIHNGCKHAKGK